MGTGVTAQPQEQPTATVSRPEWSLPQRIAFRFVSLYFMLYLFPYPVGSLGAGQLVVKSHRAFEAPIVAWVGTNVLLLPGPIKQLANGSGDQTFDYVLVFVIAVAAALGTVIWSVLDRKTTNYDRVHEWLRLFVRISVGLAMISYGGYKIFRMQFPEPALARYVDTYGQTSPRGLLWIFMGISRAYSTFGGVGEMIGGILLFIPRLTLLGALVTFGVLMNVLMLNFCYDVPRKLYTIHLVAMCLFLMLPDIKRMLNLFVFNRTAEPVPSVPLFKDAWFNKAMVVAQIVILIGASVDCLHDGYRIERNIALARLPEQIRGIWSVDNFVLDGTSRPALVTDDRRWQRVVLDDTARLIVQKMDGSLEGFVLKLDMTGRSMRLSKVDDDYFHDTLHYEQPQMDEIVLEGSLRGKPLRVDMRRMDLSDPARFLLLNRGFHMVTEFPENR